MEESYVNIKLTIDQKREFARKRPWIVAVRFALLASLYAGLAYVGLRVDSLWLWVPVWAVLGAILGGLNLIAHECVHSSFSNSARINRVVGSILMASNFLNFTLHRGYHLKHHAHTTQDDDTQNEIGLYGYRTSAQYLKDLLSWSSIFNSFFYNEWKYSVLAFFGKRTPFFNTKASDLPAVRMDLLAMVLWCVLLGAMAYHNFRPVFYTFLVPIVFFFPFILYLISLPEHYKVKSGANAIENTRTVKSTWLGRLIFWNINYHTIHHAFPYIPFYNLPKAHRLIEKELMFYEPSYIGFHLKVWRDLKRAGRGDREAA